MVDSKAALFSILMMVGGAIGVASVFSPWTALTGWELMKNMIDGLSGGSLSSFYGWIPLMVLVSSISALITGLVAIASTKRAFGSGMISAGVMMAIIAILFIFTDTSGVIGTGVYMAVAAGIVMAASGALRSSFG
ncbi:MAG: hypothetical protein FWH47_04320 [Methanomassiliicoccaceae archaeon]|nr:hypothetical protein [Methanomassiliicoccaceae archaeon]